MTQNLLPVLQQGRTDNEFEFRSKQVDVMMIGGGYILGIYTGI